MSYPRHVEARTRGATLSLYVEVLGDGGAMFDGTETARAVLKRIAAPQSPLPGDDAPAALQFIVTWVPAQNDMLPAWHLVATAEQTAALPAGYYVADLRIALASGAVEQTPPITLDLRERVTGPAT